MYTEEYLWSKRVNYKQTNLRGLSPRANYIERPPLVGEVSANVSRIENGTWSA
jgi:hypothetical protein